MRQAASALAFGVLLCSCNPQPSVKARPLEWKQVELPWTKPEALLVTPSAAAGTRVFAMDYSSDSQLYTLNVASWDSTSGFHDVHSSESLSARIVPKLSWNGALLVDYSELGADQSITRVMVSDSLSMPLYQSAYSRRPKVKVGAATEGQAWLVRNVPYQDNSRASCRGGTVEFFAVGGDAGVRCPFDERFTDAGLPGDSTSSELPFDVHPTRRLMSRGECAFVSFDQDGRLLSCGALPGTAGDQRRFWPTDDEPPTLIVEDGKYDALTDSVRVDDVVAWRWEDGGVVQRRSELYGKVQFIRSMTRTSRGVVVVGFAPVDSPDGSGWFPNSWAMGQLRVLLVSSDGSQVLKTLDVGFLDDDQLRLVPDFIGEDERGLFAFDINAKDFRYELWVAPLNFE